LFRGICAARTVNEISRTSRGKTIVSGCYRRGVPPAGKSG
jgi:hypothetical protein